MIPKAYEVHLEVFEGPLDLLLYLIKKNDLDIENIPISQITKEYISYLELMKELKLDVVGDFLVMASELMQIKARSLLPSQQSSEEEGPDPRSELVAKLKEYEKFKEAAGFLARRAEEYQDVFYRGAPRFQEREKSLNIRIFDLLSTLREVLDRTEDDGRVVASEEFPIETMVTRILDMLESRPSIPLLDIFQGLVHRRAVITCFMALLELVKLQQAFARQDSPFGEIMIHKKEAPPEEVIPVWPEEERSEAAPAAEPEAAAEAPAAEPEEVAEASAAEPEAAAEAPVAEPEEIAEASAVEPEAAAEAPAAEPAEIAEASAVEPEAVAEAPVPERSLEPSMEESLAPLEDLIERPGETEQDDGRIGS